MTAQTYNLHLCFDADGDVVDHIDNEIRTDVRPDFVRDGKTWWGVQFEFNFFQPTHHYGFFRFANGAVEILDKEPAKENRARLRLKNEKLSKIQGIKDECQRRIFEVYPLLKQSNTNARASIVLAKKASHENAPLYFPALTQEEKDFLALHERMHYFIDARRARSQNLEAMVEALTVIRDVIEFNPKDDANWQNMPDEPPVAPPPPAVPPVVSMQSAQLLLAYTPGSKDAIEAVIAGIPDPIQRGQALVLWNKSQNIVRDGAFIPVIQSALGWTDEQVDTMFIEAAAIDAAAVARGQ